MTHKNVLLPLILASLFFTAINTALAGPAEEMAALELKADRSEAVGFFGGAILGGLVAGPPGAVIAATIGLISTSSKNEHEQKNLLASQYRDSQREVIALQNQQRELQQTAAQEIERANLQRVSLSNQMADMQNQLACCKDTALSLHFTTNSTAIEQHYKSALEELARIAVDLDSPLLIVNGFADSRGASNANQRLSEQRVDAVVQVLLDQGVNADNIQSAAFGETRTLSQSNNPEVFFFDRRVTVELRARNNELFTLSE
tara:strand:+ start:9699 stop:10478 length:780 start_codon:yes stop_codon:yes gene_type:complete